MTWQTTTDLLPHQPPAVDKLIRPRVGGLFMDMGTGKTRTAIELAHLRQRKIDRVVWFCPVSLRETIDHEIRKHTNTANGDIHIFDDSTTQRSVPRSARWHIVGIQSMSSSDRTVLAVNDIITPDTCVIVDESSYIKGHNSIRTRRITTMSQRARYRLALTGTPMTQGVVDLYAQMKFLSPKILGYPSFYSFAANHLEYSENYPGLIVRTHNVGWLAAKIQPYVYQITKEEAGLNLLEKLYDSRYFWLTPEQEAAYEQAKEEILFNCLDDLLDSYVIFQLFTALQQIVSGFWNRNGKLLEFPHHRLDTLRNLIQDLPDEKIIIWCKYRYSVRAITEMLLAVYGAGTVAQYYGDLTPMQRNAELHRFRHETPFLVATMETGGHGLNLTESAYGIFYENGFKFGTRMQAEDRQHRIGQVRRPTYLDVVSRSGIEQRITDSLAKKGNVVDDFRRRVKNLKNMSRSEVREYIRRAL